MWRASIHQMESTSSMMQLIEGFVVLTSSMSLDMLSPQIGRRPSHCLVAHR